MRKCYKYQEGKLTLSGNLPGSKMRVNIKTLTKCAYFTYLSVLDVITYLLTNLCIKTHLTDN